jgi:hypothetical protein
MVEKAIYSYNSTQHTKIIFVNKTIERNPISISVCLSGALVGGLLEF